MSGRKRLVLFVEKSGDESAVPALIKRLLAEKQAFQHIALDNAPFLTSGLSKLVTPKGIQDKNWERWLAQAQKRQDLGGVLLLVDGDMDTHDGTRKGNPFCPSEAAKSLSERARAVGAGRTFSIASVIAMKEYESWLIAGVSSLAGCPLPDGRLGVKEGTTAPGNDLEQNPRNAKGWLNANMWSGYKETLDQAPLTRMVSFERIRERKMRSFIRLEKALTELVEAIKSGSHIVTP